MASTKAGEIGPAGQSFMEQAKAMASGHSDSSSGTSGGSGSSSGSGSSGGSGNSSSGGNSPPGNPPSSGGESNTGGNMPRGDTRKLVLVMGYTSLLATVLLALGWAWFAFSDTTEQGQKYAQQKREYREKREAREHEKVMAEKRLKEAHIRERNGMSPFPESQTVTKPVPAATRTVCTPVRENEAVTRLTAAQPGFGQCITLPGSSTRQLFFLMLNSPPKEITGRASFAHMREEMEADKIERRARCMAKTGDAEYCEAEMRKRVGVRVGEPCLTMDSPDRCVSYLKGKTHVPIVVHSNEPVSIHMN